MPPGSLNHEPIYAIFYNHFFNHERGEDPGRKPYRYVYVWEPYRYVPPQRVGFLGLFGLKTLCSF